MSLALRALLFWLLLFALAAGNGALREFVLRPALGDAALPLSGVMLALLLAIAILAFVARQGPLAPAQAWALGAGWLALTLLAETALTLKAGNPASDVVAQVAWPAIRAGNLVALAYLVVLLAPPLYARLLRD